MPKTPRSNAGTPRRARKRSGSATNPGKSKKSKRTLPRAVIRTSAGSAPNIYCFKRSYDHPFTIGVADDNNGVYVNSDSKYMIVKLTVKFSELPDYGEFQHLFSQYKITSSKHSLVPYYSQNQPVALNSGGAQNQRVPNYEIFALPTATTAQYPNFEGLTTAEIDSFLQQTQRKGHRLMPSKTQVYWTKHPKVVGYSGPIDKGAGSASMEMVAPGWLMTTPGIPAGMINDQTQVEHYGMTLIIRRVDGKSMANPDPATIAEPMGFRMEHEVYFKTRQVR